MKFTANVATNTNGSHCQAEFEIDDDELAGMTDAEQEEFLHEQAMDAVFEAGIVTVWHEEAEV